MSDEEKKDKEKKEEELEEEDEEAIKERLKSLGYLSQKIAIKSFINEILVTSKTTKKSVRITFKT